MNTDNHSSYEENTVYQGGGGSGGDPVAIMNAGYPYEQIFIPARAMSPGANASSPAFIEKNISSREVGFGVWEFSNVSPGKVVSFDIDIHGSKIDVADPQFTLYPVFFQDNEDTVNGPVVEFSAGITCRLIGDTLDTDFDPPSANSIILCPVRDRWVNSGGEPGAIRNGMRITQILGSTPQADQNNTFVCHFERRNDAGDNNDTYANTILLRGIVLQWKNKFENIAQIPAQGT